MFNVAKVKENMKKRRLGTIPECRLLDLNQIVQKLKVSNNRQEVSEAIITMMDELAHRLRWHAH